MCKKLIYLISLATVLIVAQSASADLVGHWLLDGDGTDSSDYGNHGTINGNVAPAVDRFGNPSGAMSFAGGGGDNINVGDAPEFNMTGAITITAWVYLDSTSPVHGGRNGRIVGKMGANGRRAWSTGIEKNVSGVPFPATVQVASNGSTVVGLSDNTQLPLDKWVHYAGVYTPGTSLEVYLDGQLSSIRTNGIPASQYSTNGQSVLIGNRPEAGDCGWYGSLDDVRIYNEALTAAEIIQVMIGVPPGAASNPSPANEAPDVPRDVVLKWTPGEFAPVVNGHTVYLSKNFNDVNDGIGGTIQSASSYAPAQRFDFETVYYWRIDEVNGPPDFAVHQGDVWQFTTEPVIYAIENVIATASSSSQGKDPKNTVNGSGLDDSGLLHGNDSQDNMWLSGTISPQQPPWIAFEFEKVLKLHELWVWNSNDSFELGVGFGFKEVSIEYSEDDIIYTTLGTTYEFNQALGEPNYAHNTTIDMEGIAAKYVKLTANSNWGSVLSGLSEVRFFYTPVSAREPSPDSGATDVDPDVTLTWRAGREAATHDVYLSTDKQAVIDGNVPVMTVTEASYAPSLDLAGTYYWRVDEVNDAESWQGDVWSLSTQEYLVVDDFEDFDGDNPIWETWLDGVGFGVQGTPGYYPGNGTGSAAGNETTASTTEETIVYDGSQSMPLFYNNTVATYSEVTANVADLHAGQDWTRHGIKALTLRFSGDPDNILQQMYVKINGTTIPYDGDVENLTRVGWQMWYIDLASLASLGVSLSNVTELAIGFERIGAFGGQGVVFLDAIRLYSYDRQVFTPSDPGNAGLVTHYKLDQNANDSSGNGHNGTVEGAATWTSPGWDGTGACMKFGGDSDRITVESFDVAGSGITLAAWIKPSTFKNDARMLSKSEGSGTADHYWAMVLSGSGENNLQFRLRTDVGGTTSHTSGDAFELVADEWTHVAVAWDASDPYMRMYKNGREIFSRDKVGSAVATSPGVKIGIGNQSVSAGPVPGDMTRPFDGLMDEVRMYDRGLSVAEITWLAGMTKPFDKPF